MLEEALNWSKELWNNQLIWNMLRIIKRKTQLPNTNRFFNHKNLKAKQTISVWIAWTPLEVWISVRITMLKIRSPNLEKKYPGQERDGGSVLNQSGAFSSLLRIQAFQLGYLKN